MGVHRLERVDHPLHAVHVVFADCAVGTVGDQAEALQLRVAEFGQTFLVHPTVVVRCVGVHDHGVGLSRVGYVVDGRLLENRDEELKTRPVLFDSFGQNPVVLRVGLVTHFVGEFVLDCLAVFRRLDLVDVGLG